MELEMELGGQEERKAGVDSFISGFWFSGYVEILYSIFGEEGRHTIVCYSNVT
jgi:hypothetical protein